MREATAKPFPWEALDRTTTPDARAFSELLRFARAHATPAKVAAAFQELLGARVAIVLPKRSTATSQVPTVFAPDVALAIAPNDAAVTQGAILVELEAALAVELVARGLRRSPPNAVEPGKAVSEKLAGALAAVIAGVLRRAAPDVPLRVVGAGRPAGVRAAHGAGAGTALVLALRLDDAAHAVRIVVPAQLATPGRLPGPVFDRAALARLGDAPLSIPVVAATSRARSSEIAALAPGDVWLPGGWAPPAARAIAVAAPRAERGLRVTLEADGRLVMTGGAIALPWEAPMDEAKGEALVDAMGEVPVVVRVEVGSAELPARAWAALEPGDVIALGRRLGDPAVLRVSGIEVARGELVELDGEIGVRIVARTEDASR